MPGLSGGRKIESAIDVTIKMIADQVVAW